MPRYGVLAVAAVGGLLLAGCSTAPSNVAARAPVSRVVVNGANVPTIDGARALAQEALDRYAAGDAGGAWDLLDAASQAQVSRSDYVAVHEACPLRAPSYAVRSARMETPTQVVVTIVYLGTSQAYKVLFENGQWRWQMQPPDVADYKNGAAANIARLQMSGGCL